MFSVLGKILTISQIPGTPEIELEKEQRQLLCRDVDLRDCPSSHWTYPGPLWSNPGPVAGQHPWAQKPCLAGVGGVDPHPQGTS